METKIKIKTLDDTNRLSAIISGHLFPGFILGSGKTTFTKYLAKHMGISANLNSPTFTILKVYDNENLNLYHMDVYRLEEIGYDFELDEFIYGNGVSVIEWYPYIEMMLPVEMLRVSIRVEEDDLRTVTIQGEGRYLQIVKDIDSRYRNEIHLP